MQEILEKQKKYFATKETYDVGFRILQLKRLKLQIMAYYPKILSAFKQDLNKNEFDVVTTEIGPVMEEINYMIKHLKGLAKPQKKCASFMNIGAKGYIMHEPYGTVLIASPWNYPLQLSLLPLVGAIAGGNTIVLKPSRNTPNVTKVIEKILNVFDSEYIFVVTKDEDIAELFSSKFDLIFYTGSYKKAQELLSAQANNLTPMILELGGKSPCFVDKDADVDLSAKKIVWAKFLNAGQTCVAPDYVLVHSEIKEAFVEACKKWIATFYYSNDELNSDFVKVINKKALERLTGMIDINKTVFGGKVVGDKLEPTIMTDITYDDKCMQEEIFGPIMPILEFQDFEQEFAKVNEKAHPLALYYFGMDKEKIYMVKNYGRFGGGCINDCVVHLLETSLPFGGFGESGMGAYHGKKSFYSFTREKSILHRSKKMELKTKFPPQTKGKLKIAKWYFGIKNLSQFNKNR
jgi:aldehyde dehydrogenase (NAD+)